MSEEEVSTNALYERLLHMADVVAGGLLLQMAVLITRTALLVDGSHVRGRSTLLVVRLAAGGRIRARSTQSLSLKVGLAAGGRAGVVVHYT